MSNFLNYSIQNKISTKKYALYSYLNSKILLIIKEKTHIIYITSCK